MNIQPLRGLIAATHTPFFDDGALNLDAVERQAAHLSNVGIATVFIGGSTGESASLTFQERFDLAARWMNATQGSEMEVVIHVGANCLREAGALARQAGELKARAMAMVAPNYFKPSSLENLVACCAQVALNAPDVPFYFYDIPALTGVHFSMPQFMELAAKQIPNFAGLKFTNSDLAAFQLCRNRSDALQVLWGIDEAYLAALALGATGAIGSTFNFAAPLAQCIETAFAAGDLKTAQQAQLRIVQLVQVLAGHSYLPAAKAVMKMLGVDVGPARLPYQTLDQQQCKYLHDELEALGFFQWMAK